MTLDALPDRQLAVNEAMRALTFRLQDEIFAIEACMVREIMDVPPVTRVPKAPGFAGGLVNVRGRVVPLADLRVAFGMDRSPVDADTRVMVIEIDLDGEPAIVGVLADRVHDVTDLDLGTLEEAPRVGMRWRADYIRGVARRGDAFVILPDIAHIFDCEVPPARSERT